MKNHIRSGKLCGEKIRYDDGIGCCVWYPLDEEDDDAGICFDFSYEDIDDLINLLEALKHSFTDKYEDLIKED